MQGSEVFGDLSLTIAQIDCQLGRENCKLTEDSGEYVYGSSVILLMRILPSLEHSVGAIGQIVILVTTILFCYLVKTHESFYTMIFTTGIILSPPYQLLIERMNIDILMAVGLWLAAITFANKKISFSLAILTLTILVKFYTLMTLSQYVKTYKGKSFLLFTSLAVSLVAITLVEFRHISEHMPQVGGGSFGLKVLIYWIQKPPSNVLSFLLTALIAGSIFLYAQILRKSLSSNGWTSRSLTSTNTVILRFFSITSLSIFVASSNWDYRLVFFNVPFFLIICAAENVSRVLRIGQYVLFLAINFLSFNVPGPLQLIGDIALLFAILTFIAFAYVKREDSIESTKK